MLNFFNDNPGVNTIINIIALLISCGFLNIFLKFFKKKNYIKVLNYIKKSEKSFFEIDNVSNELNIDKLKLRKILREIERKEIIKNHQIDGTDKYTFFIRL